MIYVFYNNENPFINELLSKSSLSKDLVIFKVETLIDEYDIRTKIFNNQLSVVFKKGNKVYEISNKNTIWFIQYPFIHKKKMDLNNEYSEYQNSEVNALLCLLISLPYISNMNRLTYSDPFYYLDEPVRSYMIFGMEYEKTNSLYFSEKEMYFRNSSHHIQNYSPKGLVTKICKNFYTKKRSSSDKIYIIFTFLNRVFCYHISDNFEISRIEIEQLKYSIILEKLKKLKKSYFEGIFIMNKGEFISCQYSSCEPQVINYNLTEFCTLRSNIINILITTI